MGELDKSEALDFDFPEFLTFMSRQRNKLKCDLDAAEIFKFFDK